MGKYYRVSHPDSFEIHRDDGTHHTMVTVRPQGYGFHIDTPNWDASGFTCLAIEGHTLIYYIARALIHELPAHDSKWDGHNEWRISRVTRRIGKWVAEERVRLADPDILAFQAALWRARGSLSPYTMTQPALYNAGLLDELTRYRALAILMVDLMAEITMKPRNHAALYMQTMEEDTHMRNLHGALQDIKADWRRFYGEPSPWRDYVLDNVPGGMNATSIQRAVELPGTPGMTLSRPVLLLAGWVNCSTVHPNKDALLDLVMKSTPDEINRVARDILGLSPNKRLTIDMYHYAAAYLNDAFDVPDTSLAQTSERLYESRRQRIELRNMRNVTNSLPGNNRLIVTSEKPPVGRKFAGPGAVIDYANQHLIDLSPEEFDTGGIPIVVPYKEGAHKMEALMVVTQDSARIMNPNWRYNSQRHRYPPDMLRQWRKLQKWGETLDWKKTTII
jgi:hypothetical protein